ncbi:hypothetical protein [Endomicrobium proavitum]|uniref:Uncharacterized protein n=1 Tax=Endomicrobium proavitum TaxID=1408281 RepID=A0A0G3WJX6_9BACT|nr:hypothetical protein [Endomicrobium proavitum]AKL98608.1 conserved exported protein of unknown function [Endomicrobium proavitum]
MKKILLSLCVIFTFCAAAFCAGERYIIFFSETSDIPAGAVEKILSSKRFCIVVPIAAGEKIPDNLDELASSGKAELSLVFNPEPIFPVLAQVYKMSGAKNLKASGFGDYVSGNLKEFANSANRESFGAFLKSGEVSKEILSYFAGAKLSWVNVQNAPDSLTGAFLSDGINAFVIYDNFPTAQKDVMPWLAAKTGNIIPVLLTKKHLSNAALMKYLIDLFEKSLYIKPAVPLYVSTVAKDLIPVKKSVSFSEESSANENVLNKLYAAAGYINKYRGSSSFDELSYKNAQSELGYLCGFDLLNGIASNAVSSVRMFDAAYNNIFRLLGYPIPDEASSQTSSFADAGSNASQIKQISGGVSITNEGYIYGIAVYNSGESIRVDVAAAWGEKVDFIDLYIDMNNLDWAGSTSMLAGAPGFLTSDSGWEYAVRITKNKALLYRHSAEGAALVSEINVTGSYFSIPNRYLRGNPENWGYQAVSVSQNKEITDFLNQTSKTKSAVLSSKPVQLTAIRIQK